MLCAHSLLLRYIHLTSGRVQVPFLSGISLRLALNPPVPWHKTRLPTLGFPGILGAPTRLQFGHHNLCIWSYLISADARLLVSSAAAGKGYLAHTRSASSPVVPSRSCVPLYFFSIAFETFVFKWYAVRLVRRRFLDLSFCCGSSSVLLFFFWVSGISTERETANSVCRSFGITLCSSSRSDLRSSFTALLLPSWFSALFRPVLSRFCCLIAFVLDPSAREPVHASLATSPARSALILTLFGCPVMPQTMY